MVGESTATTVPRNQLTPPMSPWNFPRTRCFARNLGRPPAVAVAPAAAPPAPAAAAAALTASAAAASPAGTTAAERGEPGDVVGESASASTCTSSAACRPGAHGEGGPSSAQRPRAASHT